MRFYILTDVEGVSGVTTYAQAEGTPFAIDMLMNDVKAVVEGLLCNPQNEILLYDEHMDGCNLLMDQLPENVQCVRGKPIEGRTWQGISSGYDALLMIGFHARAGCDGALLPHTYSHNICDIFVNGESMGEIGIEAMIAGERGVPLVLVSGDSAGVKEAQSLVPGVIGVSVKIALDETQAICFPPQKTASMLRDAAASIASNLPATSPVFPKSPVRLEIVLRDGVFGEAAVSIAPEHLERGRRNWLLFESATLSSAWNEWLRLERRILRAIGV